MSVSLFAKLTFGSTGAVTLTSGNGIKSVVKNSTGDYTITLQDTYNSLLNITHVYDETGNSGTAPAAPGMFVKANAVTNATTPTIEIVTNSAGTATNPASGEILLLEIILSNSSVTP